MVAVERRIFALEERTGNKFMDHFYEMAAEESTSTEDDAVEKEFDNNSTDSSDSTNQIAAKRRMNETDDETIPRKTSRNQFP